MSPASAQKKQYTVFDADSHVLEPQAVWDKYLDPEYRVVARSWFWHEVDEVGPHTILNGRPAPELPSHNIPRYAIWKPGMTPDDVGKLDPGKRHGVNPGASDAKKRLKDMDAMGVDKALLFPTMFGEYFPLVENPDVAWALARAYNTWVLEFAKAAPERLIPAAVLPMQDAGFAVREARRVAALGFRAVTIRPVFVNGHFPSDAYYRPLLAVLEELGLVACIHPAAGPAAKEMDSNSAFIERVTGNLNLGHPVAEFIAPAMDNATFLLAFMSDGLWEKFPKLKVAFMHSGIAWLPLSLEKTETYLWLSNQEDPVSLNPEGVFEHRQNAVTFSGGDSSVRRMPEVFAQVGAWGSRYPNHDAASAGEAIKDLQQGKVPAATIAALMGDNIARLFSAAPAKKKALAKKAKPRAKVAAGKR